jgi:hypothetical protein
MVTVIKKGSTPDQIQKKIRRAFRKNKNLRLMDLAGLLSVEIDPLKYQKKM